MRNLAPRIVRISFSCFLLIFTFAASGADPADNGGYSVGQAVEVKRGMAWKNATIAEFDGTFYRVTYTDGPGLKKGEWVTLERIRKPGDTRDIPYAKPTPIGKKPDDAGGMRPVGGKLGGAAKAETPQNEGSLTSDLKADAADIASAKEISPGKDWTYQPDNVPAVKLPEITMTVPGGGHTTLHSEDFVTFSAPAAALAFVNQSFSAMQQEKSRVDVLDLQAGRLRGSYTLSARSHVMAASPAGQRVAVMQFGAGTDQSRIDVFDLSANPPKAMAAFQPFGNEKSGFSQAIRHVQFVGEDHLLVMSEKYHIALFTLPDCKPVYSLHLDGRNVFPPPVLSPDGKYFVVEDKDGFYFYEALTGNPAGTIAFPVNISEFTASDTLLLLSSDGKRLARSYAHGIQLFSLDKSPGLVADFLFPGSVSSHKRALWVSPNDMLVSDRYLIDLEKQIVVWQYDVQSLAHVAVLGDRTYVFNVEKGSSIGSAVNSIKSYLLPEDKVIQTVNGLDPKTLFVTQPGDKVTLSVQVAQGEATKVLTDHFTRELQAKGYVLADDSPLKLEVSIGDFNSKEVEYRVQGRANPVKAQVTNQKMGVQFILDGKVIWEAREFSAAPQTVKVKRGQSLDSAIQEHQSNDWHQLESVSLPRQVPAPRDPPGYGRTDLGGEGDAKPRHRMGNHST